MCLVPGVYDDAYQKAIELQKEHGYTFIHPFDDLKVIAGQGTIALEILEEMPDVEAVIVRGCRRSRLSRLWLALRG